MSALFKSASDQPILRFHRIKLPFGTVSLIPSTLKSDLPLVFLLLGVLLQFVEDSQGNVKIIFGERLKNVSFNSAINRRSGHTPANAVQPILLSALIALIGSSFTSGSVITRTHAPATFTANHQTLQKG
jgi:hypothetical protein